MPSDVDVCNLALAYLGDTATVASIDPPSGSAQSAHCARFYPMALRELLEMHMWGFSSVRVALAQVANPTSTWTYAYAAPSDCLNFIAILADDASDDYSAGLPFPYSYANLGTIANFSVGVYTPQPFQVATDDSGSTIILTNQENAVLRYTRVVTDINQWSPMATEALARLLASKLAGPLLKGDTGRAETKAQMQAFMEVFQRAVESDANQRKLNVVHTAPWIANR